MLKFYRSFLGMLDLKAPIIAALHGSAVGAGLCLACAADIRVAANDTKLGFTFLKPDLHPGIGGHVPCIEDSRASGGYRADVNGTDDIC
jgi:enoyl-CoA hydratase